MSETVSQLQHKFILHTNRCVMIWTSKISRTKVSKSREVPLRMCIWRNQIFRKTPGVLGWCVIVP